MEDLFPPSGTGPNWRSATDPFPTILSIRSGAHRAYIYGTTKAAKTMALAATAKDQTRESLARELMGRQIQPKILYEVFPDYQKLLNKVEVEPPPPL